MTLKDTRSHTSLRVVCVTLFSYQIVLSMGLTDRVWADGICVDTEEGDGNEGTIPPQP